MKFATVNEKKGFSLIELIVVVLIMITLLSIGAPMLSKYLREYRVEQEISKIYGSLNSQRFKSMNTGIPHGVIFNSNTRLTEFTFKDTNYNLTFDGVQEENDAKSVSLRYALSSPTPGTVILFDENGISKTANWAAGTFTVYISYPAKYNCISVSPGRVKMGVWDGSSCKVK